MKKPVIGITCIQANIKGKMVNTLNDFYFQAVVRAGGVPLIIPSVTDEDTIAEFAKNLDGVIFTGGHDIWPLRFGEEPIKQVVEITHERDDMEMKLFQKAYESGLPILGICRGIQLVNIALGGTLYQDIYSQVLNVGGHSFDYDPTGVYHSIEIVDGTIMKEIYKEEMIQVNSLHHQAIKNLGKDLRITSKAHDGIIESIESTNDRFVLAVQYHPEAIAEKHPVHQEIFNYFIEKCKKH
ncbi:gamma-glutamyl-gamma-aminobutyrate hydrolase family protein [Gudongella sp. DL1XJH-153]|uniref:gamma-glutamyl-gamma-aminobutyrate hydrolase family protein n=1 Tax=Gudongella sp. DL1XJH-153 TaxID=3409804 RepID=UPI003BB5C7D7